MRHEAAHQWDQLSDSEVRIRDALHANLASTPWAREMFACASETQKDFFRYAADPQTDSIQANSAYEALLHQLSAMMNVQVRQGQEHISALQDTPSIIVASNHLGIGGVGAVDNYDGSFDFPKVEIEAFPLGMMPGFSVAQLHQAQQVDIRKEEKGDIGAIHRKLNGICISGPQGQGSLTSLIDEINGVRKANKRNVFLLFPEGRTSGWANNGGPYDLDAFRAGTFVISCKTGMPILPVCQYFDPKRGLDLLVLPPVQLSEADLPNIRNIQATARQAMQEALHAAIAEDTYQL